MTRLLASCLLLSVSVAGCGGDDSTSTSPDARPASGPDAGAEPQPDAAPDAGVPGAAITFENVGDGAVLGGPQQTNISATSELGVTSVELFLDTMRVGAAEFAPFRIQWNTTDFVEGEHVLTARAHLGGGRFVDESRTFSIDNTAPVVTELARVERGVRVALPVSDNVGIRRVVLSGLVALELTAQPFEVEWPGSCGRGSLEVAVTDVAGWTTTRTLSVQVDDAADRDCDGYASAASGGTDCNDRNRDVNPAAYDDGTSTTDLNCDGVLGTDGDRDGVASTYTGGSDCGDYDPAVYGPVWTWRSVALGNDSSAGNRIARVGDELHFLPLSWPGTLSHQRRDLSGRVVAQVDVATSVGHTSNLLLDGGSLSIAYERSSGVEIATRTDGVWTTRAVAVGHDVVSVSLGKDTSGLVLVTGGRQGTFLLREVDGFAPVLLSTAASTFVVVDAARQVVATQVSGSIQRISYAGAVPSASTYSTYDSPRPALLDGDVYFVGRSWSWSDLAVVRNGQTVRTVAEAGSAEAIHLPYRSGVVALAGSLVYSAIGEGLAVARRRIYAVGVSGGNDAVIRTNDELHLIDSVRAPAAEVVGDWIDSNCDGSNDT
jgi:hypothetical protein